MLTNTKPIAEILNGKIYFTVGQLIDKLRGYRSNQVVLGIGHIDGKFIECPVYKLAENARETELYLYMGDPIVRNTQE